VEHVGLIADCLKGQHLIRTTVEERSNSQSHSPVDQGSSGRIEGLGCQRTAFERLKIVVAHNSVDEFPG